MSPYSKKKRVEQILTSRGCPGRCIFCASSNYWGHRYRARSPENVIEEMKSLVENYGIEEIQFTDDNLTWARTRAMKLFELMKKELNLCDVCGDDDIHLADKQCFFCKKWLCKTSYSSDCKGTPSSNILPTVLNQFLPTICRDCIKILSHKTIIDRTFSRDKK